FHHPESHPGCGLACPDDAQPAAWRLPQYHRNGLPGPGRERPEDRGAEHLARPAPDAHLQRALKGVTAVFEKIILVTRKTRLEELIERFNTRAQSQFYIEHSGGDFQAYVEEHDAYQRSLEIVRRSIETGLKIQVMDRGFVPTYVFAPSDVVVTLG